MGDIGDNWREHRKYERENSVACNKCGASSRPWDACPACGSVGHIRSEKGKAKATRRAERRNEQSRV